MFGSVSVVTKKDKKNKKDKKKKRKRSVSDDDNNTNNTNDEELMNALLGGGEVVAPQEASRQHRFLGITPEMEKRGGGVKKGSGPRDAAEMLKAGLSGRFTSGGVQNAGSGSGGIQRNESQSLTASLQTVLSELVDEKGEFNGVFVPEHLRDVSVERWNKMLEGVEGTKPQKKKQRSTTTDDRFTEYEGISNLMSEVKAERTEGKKKDSTFGGGEGSLIEYGTDRFSKESVLALGRVTVLMMPVFNPVVEGQCYITTVGHRRGQLEYDEAESEEVRNFKKCLMQKAEAEGCEMVFSETVTNLQRGLQGYIECIPVPKEHCGDLEIRFYKAIDESESTFTQSHKRVISLKEKPLSAYLPPTLPYYAVTFGLSHGYGHIIADERAFPRHFTSGVIAELLDVGMTGRLNATEREIMLSEDTRRTFRKGFDAYDWTKMLVGEEEEE